MCIFIRKNLYQSILRHLFCHRYIKGPCKKQDTTIQRDPFLVSFFQRSNWVYYLVNKMRIAYDDTTCLQLHNTRGGLFGTPITITTLTWQLMGSPKYCLHTPIAKRKRTKKIINTNIPMYPIHYTPESFKM